MLLIFIIIIIIYSYFTIINSNKPNIVPFTQNFQNLKEEITVKNADGEPDTKATIIHKANINYIPKVSVIIPVYNTEEYLRECLDSVINQTLKEIEIICVDDGSTDSSLDILKEYAEKDNRFTIITQKNLYAGVARNAGLAIAKGEYLSFLDSDDFFELEMLEELYKIIKKEKSEIIISQYTEFDNITKQKADQSIGINKQYSNNLITTLKTKKITNNLIQIINSTIPWNKIIKHNFIKNNNIYFQNIQNYDDIYFIILVLMHSNNITLYNKSLINYRINRKGQQTYNHDKTSLSFYYSYKKIYNFLTNKNIYQKYKETFLNKFIDSILYNLNYKLIKEYYNVKNFVKNIVIPEFSILEERELIGENRYNKIMELYDPDIIVSLTSYPSRINTVHLAIESLLNQTKKADKVILWLTTEEFPNKEKDLPKQLLDLTEKGLTIEWYEKNLKAYTKLIPALKKYPEAIIVTADDDIIYNKYMLYKLYRSYKKYPNYIHSHRAKKIIYNDYNINSYNNWKIVKNTNNLLSSYFYFLEGVSGTLYPPHSLSKEVFNEEKFMKLSPTGDDIWFWADAVLNNTKIKVVDGNITQLNYINGTQKDSLWNINIHKNDEQINNVLKEYPEIMIKLYQQIIFDYLEQYHLYPYYIWKFMKL